MTSIASASQTVGPFFSIGLSALYRNELGEPVGTLPRVGVRGRVLDGDGEPIPDAVLELWQADARGRYAHPLDPEHAAVAAGFHGFGRVPTDRNGGFAFSTTRPGAAPGPGGRLQAPHLNALIFMRGLLKPAATRMYFPGEPQLASDPVLELVPAARRPTLIAQVADSGALTWNVHMQGERETVFFSY